MLVFIGNFIWSQVFARVPAGVNPWGSKSIEWQLPSPVPVHNFDRIPTFGPDPYPYGTGDAAGRRIAVVPGEADLVTELVRESTDYGVVEREPPDGDGAQPAPRFASLVGCDGLLLRRVPVRLLLSPLAGQRERRGGRSTSTRR